MYRLQEFVRGDEEEKQKPNYCIVGIYLFIFFIEIFYSRQPYGWASK